MNTHPHRRARGILILDATLCLAIAVVLLGSFAFTVTKQAQAQHRLALTRAAARDAENALLAHEAGAPLPDNAFVERLATPAPAGHVWARITFAPAPSETRSRLPVSLVALLRTGGQP